MGVNVTTKSFSLLLFPFSFSPYSLRVLRGEIIIIYFFCVYMTFCEVKILSIPVNPVKKRKLGDSRFSLATFLPASLE